ncbi:MAG: alpha/beta fold hydrolase [Blastocatellia bacterium]|nr:alpha/beta fold hydrolase [Blastocatellia bacterium]
MKSHPDSPFSPLSSAPSPKRTLVWAKRIGLMALGTLGGFAFFTAAVAFPLSSLLVQPQKKRLAQLRSRHLRHLLHQKRVVYREVFFNSFDGTRLHGWFLRSGRWQPTVIALHGVTGNRTSMMRFALLLYAAGFNVFVFDGRGHGLSEGNFVTYGYHEVRDVEAVIDYLIREQQVREKTIGLLGMSMGAAIALQVAARETRVRAVWAESPFSSLERISAEYIADTTRLPETVLKPFTWSAGYVAGMRGNFSVSEVSPVEVAPRIACPVQLVHGAADLFVRPHHSQRIFDALTTPHKDLWVVGKAAHTGCFRAARREYRERLVAFFRRHLGWW